MPPFPISIRSKLIFNFAALAILIIVVFTAFSYLRTIEALKNETLKRGIDTIKTFNQMAAAYIFEKDFITVYDNARELLENSDILRINVWDDKMNLWISTDIPPSAFHQPDIFYRRIIDDSRLGYRTIQQKGGPVIEFAKPITALGKAAYLVTMEISLSAGYRQIGEKIRGLITLSGAMILVSVLLGGCISRILTRPIRQLAMGAREISRGRLDYRTDVANGDEIGKLARSFNAMAQHLQDEQGERIKTESALRRHRDKLEEIVRERTANLACANEKLTLKIDEQKRTEDALRQSEERYKRLSEVTVEGIVFHEDGIFIDANTTFERMTGYRRDELTGRNLVDFLVAPGWRDFIRGKIASRYGRPYEIEGLRKDGTNFPVEIEGRRIHFSSGTLGVASVRDITEKKRLIVRLQRAQKMEAIGMLAGGVAHDLNNILSGIVGYPDLLLYQLPHGSPLRKPIETIRETGTRAADIVQNLLTLARRGVVVRETVDVHEVIRAYLASPEHEKLIEGLPGLRIDTCLDGTQPFISGSAVHLSKTLMNLLTNAVESTGRKGKITIHTKNRHISESEIGYENIASGEYIVLTVADNGEGISPKNLERIFEPFYTKKVMGKSGTGLGLAVVWGTVKDHGGYIDVKSAEGKGTTFILYLPVTQAAAIPCDDRLPVSNLRGRGESVLVIDDIPDQRNIAVSILTTLGYAAEAVSSGEEALEHLKKNTTDLILIDMMMEPGMNGLETYRKIVKIHPGQKAVISSGFSEDDDVKEAMRLGAACYIKKPYTVDAVGRAIRAAIDRIPDPSLFFPGGSFRLPTGTKDRAGRPG